MPMCTKRSTGDPDNVRSGNLLLASATPLQPAQVCTFAFF